MEEVILENGKTKVRLLPAKGGRLDQLHYGEIPLLAGAEMDIDLSGAVWWPSPQSMWQWPPPEAIDKGAYEVIEQEESQLVVQSAVSAPLGLRVRKTYELQTEEHLRIQYQAYNASQETLAFGHWEVSRHPKGGRLLSAVGEAFETSLEVKRKQSLYHKQSTENTLYEKTEGVYDFKIASTDLKLPGRTENKLFLDGKGWVAYYDRHVLLVKVIQDQSKEKIAPEQAEIEVYVSPILPMVEVEVHGNYQAVKPGNTTDFQVDWYWEILPAQEQRSTKELLPEINKILNKHEKIYKMDMGEYTLDGSTGLSANTFP
ncbi:hypothetical protein GCM10023331_21980 [Algivirga pacifica]|uniref:DUF4380 domain-containing protein n=2 Tax=Algivirga pacifica TaxID=1162670 RepID=A0ABP9DA78_9BACT